MTHVKSLKSWALAGCAVFAMAQGAAAANEQKVDFNIYAQSLGEALNEFGLQSGKDIYFLESETANVIVDGLVGSYGSETALQLLLDRTGVEYRVNEFGTFLVGSAAKGKPGFQKIAYVESENYEANLGAYEEDERVDEASTLELDEITVSASRIKKSGFEAPNPVTVVGADDMEARGTVNVADIINELPAFNATITPASTNLNSRDNGTNTLDLRGIGTNRNLVLVNGRRHVPTTEFGGVNINVIPSIAIQRVEVVTGGASAAWGSDAVSGVVNILYDKNLDGLKAEASFGTSGQGDAENYRLSLAYGGEIDDGRGRFMIAAEYNDNKGIPRADARDWSNEHYALIGNPDYDPSNPSSATPQFIIRPDAHLSIASPNGVTLGLGLPTDNLEFLPDGSVIPRALGVGNGNFFEGGSGSTLSDSTAAMIPLERQSILATFDYEITDGINFFFEGSAAQSESTGGLVAPFAFGKTISAANPFLPDSVRDTLVATGTPLVLFRTIEEVDPISSVSKSTNIRLVAGFNGQLDDKYDWEVYFQHGRTDFSNRQTNNMIVSNLDFALDAVVDPATGAPACAAALSGVAPNCVPINLFGAGSPSQAALDYVLGTSISDTKLTQQVVAANISGDIFDGWAGPIAATVGAEYRKEKLNREVDDLSEQAAFLITNAQPLEGDLDVKEVFGEVLVPIMNDDSLGNMNLSAAIRYADYSNAGGMVTWKTGLTYDPTDEFKIRGTISRDIRAPSIGETFLKTLLLFGDITNPFTGTEDFTTILNTGNSELTEERALTKTVGIVYSPEWFERFQVSVDWYDIDISDAINSISSQDIVDRCFAGAQNFCDLITFNGDGTLKDVTNRLLNLGSLRVKGVDFETRYSMPVGDEGTLGFKLLGTYAYSKVVDTDGTNPQDFAGEVGAASGFGSPKWKVRGNVSYNTGPFGLNTQVRYVGAGKYNSQFGPEQLSDADNNIAAQYYVDISARYQLDVGNGQSVELFGGINNAFDNDPPVIPLDFISNAATNAIHYDVIGRYFYFGVRAGF